MVQSCTFVDEHRYCFLIHKKQYSPSILLFPEYAIQMSENQCINFYFFSMVKVDLHDPCTGV